MSNIKKEIIKAAIINALWTICELALIIWASVNYHWLGFGIAFGACFLLRVILYIVDRIRGWIAFRKYTKLFGPMKGWDSLD